MAAFERLIAKNEKDIVDSITKLVDELARREFGPKDDVDQAIDALGRLGEPGAPISIPWNKLPTSTYIRGPRYKVTFDKLTDVKTTNQDDHSCE